MMNNEMLKIIYQALREDQSHRDITTTALVRRDSVSSARIIAKENCIVCGIEIMTAVFRKLDQDMRIQIHYHEGESVPQGAAVVSLHGKTRALLTGERTALNFISYLSGISTLTSYYVKEVEGYPVKIMDTRKTIPGLRSLVKMAVRCGGGINHRFNLNEMVIIKDNHIVAYERDATIQEAIRHVRRKTTRTLIIEVDTLDQFKQAIEAHPDVIMLDNMSIADMENAVAINKMYSRPCLLEALGGVTLGNIKQIAATGVDRISIGALTHSPRSIDFSLEFAVEEKRGGGHA